MARGPPMDEETQAATCAALQTALEHLLFVLNGLKEIKAAVDLELNDTRPDAKIIPFRRPPRKN